MTTTPAGRPAWERANDHSAYGGHTEKRNYQNLPIVNPRTDVGAEHIARMAADLAAVQRVAPFARVTFTGADSTNTHPTVSAVEMMTGVYSGAPYTGNTPPTGFPSVSRVADGQYRVTLATSYTDPYGVAGTLSLTAAMPTAYKSGSSDAFYCSASALGSNVFDVHVYNGTTPGVAEDPTVTVEFS